MSGRSDIKVGFCVSYDWHLLRYSLPLVYPYSDSICLSIDIHRRGWSGSQYPFDEEAFASFLSSADPDRKIRLYEADFSDPKLSPMENDNRQRRMMSDHMGRGGWHIQVDSDEYFLDFKEFVAYLRKFEVSMKARSGPLNICCPWISIFKHLPKGYLVIDNSAGVWETTPFATMNPEYLYARKNSHFNIISNHFVVHETWARSKAQLRQKLDSWGHVNDFDSQSYMNFWDALDEHNYRYAINFHPIKSEVWHRLKYVEAGSVSELISKLAKGDPFKLRMGNMYLTNSRNWNRIVSLMKRIGTSSEVNK